MRLTKPLHLVPADQCSPELEERLVDDVGPTLVTSLQPPITIQPRERPFHDPPMPSQPLAGVDAPPGDTVLDATLAQGLAAAPEVLALIGG